MVITGEQLKEDSVYKYIEEGLLRQGFEILNGYILHKVKFGPKEARSEISLHVKINNSTAALTYNYGRLKRELAADAKYDVL